MDGLLKQETGPKYAAFSAHPIIDPETEEMFFFSRNGGPGALPRILYGYRKITMYYVDKMLIYIMLATLI